MTIEIRLLGRFSALRDTEEIPPGAFGGKLGRTLVRILLTRRGEYVARDVLTEALWPGRAPADPGANLNVLVNRARKALGDPSLILTGAGGYSFAAGDGCRVDAEGFLAEVIAGHGALDEGQPIAAMRRFRLALQIWGGDPLPEDAYDDWAQEYRTRLSRAHLEALEGGAEAALATGNPAQAVPLAELAVAREPLRETAHLLLVRALAASGDKAAALAAFDTARERFSEELGLDLSPELLALQLRILRGEPQLRLQRRAAPAPARPVGAPPFEALAFVGRERELATVLSTTSGAGARVVVVAGPPGAGKSRLLAEAAARTHGPVLAARAFLAERDEAWGLARSVLRAALAVDATAALAIPARAAQALADVIPEIEDVRAVAHPPVAAESRRALALEGAIRLLESVVGERAAVLVDDLQWADATSLGWLGQAVQRVPALAFVLAYRSEEVPDDSALSSLLRQLSRSAADAATITLGALSADEISQLFADDELSAAAHESDGTPLALTEVVRTLAGRGVIERDPAGRWRAAEKGASSVLREVARAGQRRALRDRAHQQPPGARTTLSLLALVGRETPARVLATAAGVEQATVLGYLDQLAGAGLVRLGEGGWAPAHDLINEAVIEDLGSPQRGHLQESLAESLRGEGGDAAEVARHLAGAGDRGAAAQAYLEAARERLECYASEEAERLADAGLALDPVKALQAELFDLRAEARSRGGNLAGARADLRGALAGKRPGAPRSRILARMAMLASGSDDIARASEFVDLALTEAGKDAEARAEALYIGAIVDMNNSAVDRSRARLEEALSLFRGLGNGQRIANILDAQAMASFMGGNLREASPAFDRVAGLCTETGDLLGAASARGSRGACLAMMGHAEDALVDTGEAIELARTLGDVQNEAYACCYRAQALAALGRPSEAVRTAEGAVAIGQRLDHRELTSAALRALGIAHRAAGDLDRAEASLRRALEVAADNIPVFASRAAAELAQLLIARGQLDKAETLLPQALEVGPPFCRFEALLAQAELAAARGDSDAQDLATSALAVAEAGGYLLIAPRLRELGASTGLSMPRDPP